MSREFNRNDLLPCLALAIAETALAFGTRASWQTTDALAYALSVRDVGPAFHPHHLLFVPILQIIRQIGIFLGMSGDPIAVGQIHNVFWSIILLIGFYGTVLRISGRRAAALAGSTVILFSQGVAAFATQVESYVPAAACTMWLVWWLVSKGEGRITAGRFVGGAVPLALGILYHQAGILLCFAVAAFFAAGEGARRIRRFMVILFSAGALVFIPYVAGYVFQTGFLEEKKTSVAGFFGFCLQFAVGPHSDWGSIRNMSGRGLVDLLDGLIWSLVHLPEVWQGAARWVFVLLLLGLILWNVKALRAGAPFGGLRAFVISWVLVHILFFLWWLPDQKQFAIFVSPGIVLLFFIGFTDLRRRAPRAGDLMFLSSWVVGFAVLLPVNLSQSLLPAHRSRGPAFRAAEQYLQIAPRDCLLFASYRLSRVMLYYHDLDRKMVLNPNREMLLFFKNGATRSRDSLPAETCMVIPHLELDPARKRGAETGHSNPEGWWSFVQWAFRIRQDERTKEIIHGEVFALVDSKGKAYLHQVPKETVSQGIGGFARSLDAALRAAGQSRAAVYEDWYLRSGRILEGGGSRER